MSAPQMPPWLQEQIGKLQQSQQNLQSIMTQRQHLEKRSRRCRCNGTQTRYRKGC